MRHGSRAAACFAALSISSRLSRIQSHASRRNSVAEILVLLLSSLLFFSFPFPSPLPPRRIWTRGKLGRNAYTHLEAEGGFARVRGPRFASFPPLPVISIAEDELENWLIRYSKWSRRRSGIEKLIDPFATIPPSRSPWFSTVAGI